MSTVFRKAGWPPFLFCALLLAELPVATGQDVFWDGSDSDNWGNVNNWTPAAIPGVGDAAWFNIAGNNSPQVVNLNAARSVRAVLFVSTGTTTIQNGSGGSLTIGSGGIFVGASAGAVSIPATVVLGTTQTWEVNGGAQLSVNGLVGGLGIVKTGTGTLVLSNPSNNYGGGTFLNQGFVSVGTDLNLGGASSGLAFNGGGLITAGTVTSSRGVTIGNGGGEIVVANGVTSTFSGAFSAAGTGALTKSGNGTLVLTGNNTYTGGTVINGGTLRVLAQSLPTSGPLSVNGVGTTLVLDQSGSGIIGYGGGGQMLTMNGGSLVFSNTTGFSQNAWNGNMTLNNDTLVTSLGNATVAGQITGNVQGAGRLLTNGVIRLLGNNTYSGGTTINSGSALLIDGVESLGHTGSEVRFAGGVLQPLVSGIVLNSGRGMVMAGGGGSIDVPGGFEFTVNSTITTTGGTGLTKTGSGTLVLDGNNSHAGMTINGGVVRVNSDNDLGSNHLTLNGGTLQTSAGFTMGRPVVLSGIGGNIDTGSNAVAVSNFISGSGNLGKFGSGTLTVTNNNTYTGETFINGGTLVAGDIPGFRNLGTTGGLTFGGGTLKIPGSFTWGRGVTMNTGGGTIDTNNFDMTISQPITGASGSLTKTGGGTLTLSTSGTNTYGAGTFINGGLISVTKDGHLGSASSGLAFNGGGLITAGTVTSSRGVTIGNGGGEIVVANGVTSTFSGAFSGNGSLIKSGAGELNLAGSNNYTGGTMINSGTLNISGSILGPVIVNSGANLRGGGTIDGNVASGGRVAPGTSPGILVIDGDYSQTTEGTLEIEVQGYTPGTEHDQLQVSGTASLAGRLEIPILQPFNPGTGPILGQPIQFLSAGTRTGEFSAIVAPNLATLYPNLDLTVEVTYESDGALLSFVPKQTNIVFDENTAVTADWFNDIDTWKDTLDPNAPALPRSVHDVTIQNLAAGAQEVQIETANAFVAKLTVGGGTDDLTIRVGDGTPSATSGNLSSTLDVTVEENGVIAMNGGTLATVDVTVDGGVLKGIGLVDLSNNTLVGAGTLTVANGTVSPGFSVGHLDVDGDYQQQSNGAILLEIDDPNSFDTLAISGDASLAGTLEVVLTDIADAPVGTVFEVITTGGITGKFDKVITTGVDGIVLVPSYGASPLYAPGLAALTTGGGSVYLTSVAEGDMDPFTPGIGEEDAVAFALALTDPDTYFITYGITADEMGDIDDIGDRGLDFDDIDDFVKILNRSLPGGMTMARMLEIIEQAQSVPEPAGLTLLLVAVCVLSPRRQRSGFAPHFRGDL